MIVPLPNAGGRGAGCQNLWRKLSGLRRSASMSPIALSSLSLVEIRGKGKGTDGRTRGGGGWERLVYNRLLAIGQSFQTSTPHSDSDHSEGEHASLLPRDLFTYTIQSMAPAPFPSAFDSALDIRATWLHGELDVMDDRPKGNSIFIPFFVCSFAFQVQEGEEFRTTSPGR